MRNIIRSVCKFIALAVLGGDILTGNRGAGTGEGQWGQLAPTTLEPWGGAPTTFHIELGTVGAVVPKLGVMGHKGKLNGRKHFREKSPSFIGLVAHLAESQINFYSRLSQRYFLFLADKECLTLVCKCFRFFVEKI